MTTDASTAGHERERVRGLAYARWLQELSAQPWRAEFLPALRHIESSHPQLPRLGDALRPADEPVRVSQPAELSFAPRSLHALRLDSDGPPRLQQRIFGLLGPNGPLPIHITELARERAAHHGDHTLQRFLDTITHRFALLFYRAWASAQPVVSLDRPGDTVFKRRIGALIGIGNEPLQQRDAIGDDPKLYFAGRLARHVRDADGLLAWCRAVFDVPVTVQQWCGHWMFLASSERTRLSARGGQGLGRGALLGSSVWDVQHKFRILIGPLDLKRYTDFLPGSSDLAKLQAMVRQWVGLEFTWDVQLVLARSEVPRLTMGQAGESPARLGRSAWLGHYRRAGDAIGMTVDVESALRPRPRSPMSFTPPSTSAPERTSHE